MSFTIMTDTAANLSLELLTANGIVAIPMSYSMHDADFLCGVPDDFDDVAYYSGIKRGALVSTSQVNPQRYMEYMKVALENERDVLFIGLSSGISGSFASANVARDELLEQYPDRAIELVDSIGASLGEGLLVLRAARYRDEGLDIHETARKITALRKNIYQYFFVDDLIHLKRTGRISGGLAIVGSVLGIKPLLKGNENGRIVVCGKARGRKRAIQILVEQYARLVKDAGSQIIGISHANCPEDAAYLAEQIRDVMPPKGIILQKHEPVTGSHLGPGALALYFEGDENVRLM